LHRFAIEFLVLVEIIAHCGAAPVTNKVVIGSNMAVPDAAQPLIAPLNKYSFHEATPAGSAASPTTSTAGKDK
jgi:hypothetical protein